jgi:2-oxoglutarate dehydrogenase E1 component
VNVHVTRVRGEGMRTTLLGVPRGPSTDLGRIGLPVGWTHMDSPQDGDAAVQDGGREDGRGGRGTAGTGAFGPNAWLVEDMYDRYQSDPSSVSPSWKEFFADYRPTGSVPVVTASTTTAAPPAPAATAATAPPAPAPTTPAAPAAVVGATPLRGAAGRIVTNMEASLGVPTATSVRVVPAKLLEVNRTIVNNQLRRTTGGKVSFTHLIGYAVVKALIAVPAMNAAFVGDADGKGTPGVLRHDHVGLGLAVDVEKGSGRTLLVPCIAEADTRDFQSFVGAYEDLVRNPGTLGTVQSVPRLMPGQGVIVGVGALTVPPGFEASDPRMLAELGVGKTVTVTSTYDHRIIQGAESGLFLAYVSECLMGKHGFYKEVFESLGIPYEPVTWQPDDHSGLEDADGGHERLIKQNHVQTLINMYRVRGHLIAHLDPLDAEPVGLHPELDPLHYGLTIWDLPRTFVADGLAGKRVATLDEILSVLRDAYCRTLGVEYMRSEALDPAARRGRVLGDRARRAAPHPRPPQRRRGLRALPPHPLRGPEALRARRRGVGHRDPRRAAQRGGDRGTARVGDGDVPPRPAQRPGQHRGQVLRRDLRGVRGEPRPRVGPGVG